MISPTVPTLEMAFLLDTFLFANDLYLCCNVSNSSEGVRGRSGCAGRDRTLPWLEGDLLLGPSRLVTR